MRLSPKQREALALIASGEFRPSLVKEDDGWHARWLPDVPWLDEYVRSAVVTPLYADAENQRHETLHDAWIAALRSETGLVRWEDSECAAFAAELSEWSGEGDIGAKSEIVFEFVPGAGSEELPSVRCRRPRGRAALKALGQSVSVWGVLRGLRLDGESLSVRLGRSDTEDFLRRGSRDLSSAGYAVVNLPVESEVTAAAEILGDCTDAKSLAGQDVRLTIRVDGEPVSASEIRFLLEQGGSFVFFRDRWIEVDRGILKEALRALERRDRPKSSVLAFALGIGAVGRIEVSDPVRTGTVGALLTDIRSIAGKTDSYPAIKCFKGTLRDYQRRGVEWMRFLSARGFGALLADDMGLGKTAQAIGWLLARRADAGSCGPALVVAPLTLVSNWAHELSVFAPDLRVYLHQGAERHSASGFMRSAGEADVVVTSYNLLVRDHSDFADIAWSRVVIDEAQKIKNPDTQLARALRALAPAERIALSGTPIENTVEDLWSIEEFLNPGMLGDRKSFEERFVRPLALDPKCGAGVRLRKALEPFVLRRLKTDPAIAAEIGEKRLVREYCDLLPRERSAYESALADYRYSEHRQGDVFALLTRLKLICDGIVGEDVSGFAESGKCQRLVELLEGIFANGESALVFTQYAKAGREIVRVIEARFGRHTPYLHGALSPRERDLEVRRFSASREPSAFVLSLKAGGFGLNLTKATHVIHFDRWWNPAVENQATDRAHRIGQSKSVLVHEFITPGTLEERIDDILLRKGSLEGLVRDGDFLERTVKLV